MSDIRLHVLRQLLANVAGDALADPTSVAASGAVRVGSQHADTNDDGYAVVAAGVNLDADPALDYVEYTADANGDGYVDVVAAGATSDAERHFDSGEQVQYPIDVY